MSHRYRYQARAPYGQDVEGDLTLPSILPESLRERAARRLLAFGGLSVRGLNLQTEEAIRVKIEDVALFTRRLAVMVGSGIPIHRSIDFLSNSESEAMNRAARRLNEMVESGQNLSRAFALMPGVFPPVFLGFIRAGESSGQLVKCLESLASQLERSVAMKRRLFSGLGYPAFLLLGAIVLCALLIFGLVPAMAPALLELGVELPALTRMLLDVTRMGQQPLFWGLGILVLLVGYAYTRVVSSSWGRYSGIRSGYDRAMLSLPVSRRLVRSYGATRVLSAASMAVETGIPVVRALRDASSLCGNVHLERRLLLTCQAIAGGDTFQEALEGHSPFRRSETQILLCSAEAGDLAKAMAFVARQADEEVEASITALSTLFEPLVLALMSLVVGTVSLATFLPWVNLLKTVL